MTDPDSPKKTISVKVFPKSGRSEVEGFRNGVLIVRLKKSAEKGRANKELIEVLSEHYRVKKSEVEIVSGFNKRLKCVSLVINSDPD